MTEHLLTRVEILVQQNRFEEAEKILADLLEQEPNNYVILGIYAEVALALENLEKAEDLINTAIGISPDADGLYYVKAKILTQKKQLDDAESYLAKAIEINSQDADYFAYWAAIKLERKQYNEGLDLANEALELDAENLLALNARSTALIKLNKKEEAFHTIEGALKENPNNAYTHANYGWSLLEKGEHKKALEHFREALRNDPNYSYAQAGMAQALKAKYFLYRLFLKYAFWIGKLTAKYQWGAIIGFYLIFRAIRAIANNNEHLEPFLTPIIILLAIIAFSTWVINPISNLFLRLNKYGKHLLIKDELLSANFVGLSALVFIVGTISYFVFNHDKWLVVAFFGFAMMIPCSVMFSPSKYKNSLLIYAVVMFAVGLGAIYKAFTTEEIVSQFATVFLLGFIAFQWIANFLMIREDNR